MTYSFSYRSCSTSSFSSTCISCWSRYRFAFSPRFVARLDRDEYRRIHPTYIAPPAFATIGKEAYDTYGTREPTPPSISSSNHHASGVDTISLSTVDHIIFIPLSSIRVGDLIPLKNQRATADLVLVGTSNSGIGQLDGETDWKLQDAVLMCQKPHSGRDLLSMDAEIYGMNSPPPYLVSRFSLAHAVDPLITNIRTLVGTFSVDSSPSQ